MYKVDDLYNSFRTHSIRVRSPRPFIFARIIYFQFTNLIPKTGWLFCFDKGNVIRDLAFRVQVAKKHAHRCTHVSRIAQEQWVKNKWAWITTHASMVPWWLQRSTSPLLCWLGHKWRSRARSCVRFVLLESSFDTFRFNSKLRGIISLISVSSHDCYRIFRLQIWEILS